MKLCRWTFARIKWKFKFAQWMLCDRSGILFTVPCIICSMFESQVIGLLVLLLFSEKFTRTQHEFSELYQILCKMSTFVSLRFSIGCIVIFHSSLHRIQWDAIVIISDDIYFNCDPKFAFFKCHFIQSMDFG